MMNNLTVPIDLDVFFRCALGEENYQEFYERLEVGGEINAIEKWSLLLEKISWEKVLGGVSPLVPLPEIGGDLPERDSLLEIRDYALPILVWKYLFLGGKIDPEKSPWKFISWKEARHQDESLPSTWTRPENGSDVLDTSSFCQEKENQNRLQEKREELLREIETALVRIFEGSWGFDPEGKLISLARLICLPWAKEDLPRKEKEDDQA